MVPSPGTIALPGQPKADTIQDKLQGKRQGVKEKEKCQQREGEEEMGMCWGREEQAAAKAGREGGVILHALDTPNSTDYAGASILAPMWLQVPGDERVEAALCCAFSDGCSLAHVSSCQQMGSILVSLESFPLPPCLYRVMAPNCP